VITNRYIMVSLLIVTTLMIEGCAQVTWVKVDKPTITSSDKTFSAEVPTGWVQKVGETDQAIYITRDGPLIEFVELKHADHEHAFPELGKASQPDLLDSELADLLLAELRSDEVMEHLEVIENAPADISGNPGIVVQVKFRTDFGLQYERRIYAFLNQEGLCTLTYQAPSLHYLPLYADQFEATVASFQLK